MASTGKLEKMLILAFADSESAETGGVSEAEATVEALINPESYTIETTLKFSDDGQGQGTSGQQLKYEYTAPEEISFDFLFDNTGIIDGKPRENIVEDLAAFRAVLVDYQGDSHEPRHFKLVWGDGFIFKGRVVALSIIYSLFNPDGSPIRAKATVKFKASVEEEMRAAQEDRSSPDLTHMRTVLAGDTLPLMCHRIYGDSKHYLDVARFNRLDDRRALAPGTRLVFPKLGDEAT